MNVIFGNFVEIFLMLFIVILIKYVLKICIISGLFCNFVSLIFYTMRTISTDEWYFLK